MNPLVPIGEYRTRWLRALEALTVELRRPPHSIELAQVLGLARHSVQQMAKRCARSGLVALDASSATTPRGIRLTPAARIALGMPLAVYLAFPVGDGPLSDNAREVAALHGQAAAAELLDRYGLFCASPLLLPEALGRPGAMDAATATATALHAAIAWRDPMLVGRRDLDAARRAGVPVSVVQAGPMPATAGELWQPPRLVPAIAADAIEG